MNNFRRILIITILSMITLSNHAQNLVPNPSFENYSSCPTNFSQTNRATPWYDPTAGSSDYFNACAVGFANVPFIANGNGYQYARTGNAFTGLYALNCFCDAGREYIQVQLNSSLLADSCYWVEFYCNLVAPSGYSIDKLGAYLSDTAIHYTGPGSISVLHYTPQIVSNTFLTDTLNWMRVAVYYRAIGGEKFLTIGDFKPFSAGDTLNTGISGGWTASYYLIDDVSITKIVGCDTLNPSLNVLEQKQDYGIKLYPNPGNGATTIEYHLAESDKAILTVYDVTGKELNVQTLNSKASRLLLDESELPAGIYYYTITVNNAAVKTEKLVIMK
jgi:hypothetical protein